MKHSLKMTTLLLALSIAFLILTASQTAQAATLTVDTIADNAALTACTDAANDCSLRGAIINANTAAGTDAINFDQAIFSTAQTIAFTSSSPKQHLVINSDLTIDGPGANLLTVKGYPIGNGTYVSTIFEITGGVVGINNLTLTGGFGKTCHTTDGAFGCGGAISMSGGTVTVRGAAISGNNAERGAGIYTSGGTLTITDSTVTANNSASTGSGGGIYVNGGSANIVNTTISGNIAGYGGGVNNSGGTLNINNSTVSGNTAKNRLEYVTLLCQTAEQCQNPPLGFTCSGTQCTGYVSRDGIGGGILNNSGAVNIKNSTISGNTAQGYATTLGTWGGGGIWNRATMTVANSTITNNYGQYGGGIGTGNGATSNLSNSIVAGNSRNTSAYGGGGADIFIYPGGTTTGSYNLVQSGDTVTGTNNITGQSALLGPLANNGGPTQTHALLAGNPAIDAGDPNFDATATPFDQREAGYSRKYGSAIDIGAFEYYPQIVNTLADHDDGGCSAGDCTLREAVKYAPDGVIINFTVTGTITLTQGEIVIDKNLTINGSVSAPGITISGNNQSRIFSVGSSNTLNLSNLTLTKGNGVGSAGSGNGGAIYGSGTLNVANCTFTANAATGTNTPGNGGAIRNSSTLTVVNSTFYGNMATGNGGAIQFGNSGATITNSTIFGNTATGNGGGINNNAGTGSTSSVILSNSIVAGNSAATGPDFNGKFTGGDYNLIQNTSGATLPTGSTHNISGQDPQLGALANNGGATKTMALLANSPAIDAGDPTFDATILPFDQRGAGFVRKVGGAIDIGTFEVQPIVNAQPDLTITKSHAGNFTQGETGKTYMIIVTNSGNGATSGTVSMTDVLPSGLTATAIGGAGWNCDLNSLTCTRSDALAAGGTYSAVTLTINVADNASASVINTASVSGGGESNNLNSTASDPTTINTAPRYSISGKIKYGITPSGQPDSFVSGVVLSANGTVSASATSDSSGNYLLSNLTSGDYIVTPSKSGDTRGINSLDATRIQQQLVGITTLSPNQMVAADTDGNGVVNSLDATRIQQSLIGMQTANIIGQWKFVPGNRQYDALSGNQTGQDFLAILVGEVSGNWASASSFADSFPSDGNDENAEKAMLLETSNQNQTVERFKNHPFGQFSADLKQPSDLLVSEATIGANAGTDIQVSLPASATASNGSTITVPITVSQISAGQSIESFDFSVFYNPAILQPTLTPGSNAGTLSANCSVLSFSPVSGRVIVSGACAQAITSGSGILYNLTFTVVGAANQTSSLSFTNPATNVNTFQFNNGTPTVATANGSFTVLGTTAASISLLGRVLTPRGRGLRNAVVTMTDSTGAVRHSRSNMFGYFHFENIAAGQICVFQINSKRYTFAPQILTITVNMTELNFTAQ